MVEDVSRGSYKSSNTEIARSLNELSIYGRDYGRVVRNEKMLYLMSSGIQLLRKYVHAPCHISHC
jgi:hypothetical protein